ncbi:MAG: D-alanyl-D-alanine carboxypeptidase/D-alanyl-D-alanine-endopeptidase (penicillin-binding protein 4) [Cyclobacteriaceae bacterium]|jgi:D-alanyl-D-alanine carboxypeptidase/D-alanyl-D-alanine-endopeptidase (penicillin-binding protein 4)
MRFQNTILVALIIPLLTSCLAIKMQQSKNKITKSVSGSELFKGHFTGFALYDPEDNKYLQEQNADKYFTPASNTKLFTFYAGLKMLGDSIPGLKYSISGDSLIFWGTGDPTFLDPNFPNQPVFEFLKNTENKLYYASGNFQDTPFGEGWAWDDYPYYYQSERSAMPIYGNMINFLKNENDSSFEIIPPHFKDYVEILDQNEPSLFPNRNPDLNIFRFYPDQKKSNYKNRVAFKVSDELFAKLLSDTLNVPVDIISFKPRQQSTTLYSRPLGQVNARMLKVSENFLAEQILYMCAAEKGDTLNSARTRASMVAKHLNDLPSPPIWRDGSGLSRYNLFTPRSIVTLLEKIKQELTEEQMLSLLSVGGVDGTIRSWYKSDDDEPYIFAKTGTLSNNHSLSGFIRTKSGKLLTFSFMHNNYNSSSTPVKLEMEKTLRLIRDSY